MRKWLSDNFHVWFFWAEVVGLLLLGFIAWKMRHG